jgi:hypothetical protein
MLTRQGFFAVPYTFSHLLSINTVINTDFTQILVHAKESTQKSVLMCTRIYFIHALLCPLLEAH